ncbi:MAG: hypothetical protein ACP5H9_01855 [Candidatus Woesearchaeota archaeon]
MKKSNADNAFKTSQNAENLEDANEDNNEYNDNLSQEKIKERDLFERNIRNSFESVKKDIILLHKELKDLKNQALNQLKKKCETFSAKTEKISKELKENEETKTKEIDSLKKSVVYLEEQLKELEEFKEKLLKIETSLDEMLKETKMNSYVSAELKKMQYSLAKNCKSISKNSVPLKRYENEIKDLSEQINSLKSELYRIEEIKNSILNAQKIISRISEEYVSVKDLEHQSRKIYLRINRISANFRGMQNQIRELAENLVSKEELIQIKSEIESQLLFFEKGLKALQDESMSRKEFELKNKGLFQRVSNLKENLYSLRLKLEELSSISEKNSIKLKEMNIIQKKVADNEKRAVKHEQNIRMLKRDLENLKSSLKVSEERNDFLERKINLMGQEIESIKENLLRVQGIGLKTMEILEEKKPSFRMPKLPRITKKFAIKKPSKQTWLIAILLFLFTLVLFLIFNYPSILTMVISKLNISINMSENITKISWLENRTNITENISEHIAPNIANITANLTANETLNETYNESANESAEEKINVENLTIENHVLSEKELKELDIKKELCILRYECREINGKYYYDCYYSSDDKKCHCFIGEQSYCNETGVEFLKEKYDVFLPLKNFLKNIYAKSSSFFSIFFSKLSKTFLSIFVFIGSYRNYFIIALLLLLILFLFLNYKEEIFDFFTEVEEETPKNKSQKKKKR